MQYFERKGVFFTSFTLMIRHLLIDRCFIIMQFFFVVLLMSYLFNEYCFFQHDACRKAFENSKAQMDDISNKIKTKNVIISDTNNDLLKHKTEASQAREMEQARLSILKIFYSYISIISLYTAFYFSILMPLAMPQECIKQQDLLIPMEQAARQKVAELLSVMESEKSQGSVLKAILQAKESKEIDGIYGRLGDLGAIDGDDYSFYFVIWLLFFFLFYR